MATKKNASVEELVRDPASRQMLARAREEGVSTAWDRFHKMKPLCVFGTAGLCCSNCHMGPCRIRPNKTPVGICGADGDTIAARNYVREICAGVSAHSDHARQLIRVLKLVCSNQQPGGYKTNDLDLLEEAAAFYEVEPQELADALFEEFGNSEVPLKTTRHAPEKTQELWRKLGLVPSGIDSSVVEMMHRTTMGVDHDYRHLVLGGLRTALADGWGGSMIATLVSDILFGTPGPVRSTVNLGVLEPDQVNVLVHGHEPALSEMLAIASRDPELQQYARSKGAEGIQLAGICCTANEVLMRHGIPVAGNFLQQELALATGAVEMMVLDVQCVMPSLIKVAECFHTKLYTTSHLAQSVGVEHLPFEAATAMDDAKKLIRMAIDNYQNRVSDRVCIPEHRMDLVAGFSNRTIFEMLGGSFRSSFRPLNDAIIQGRIHGVCGVVGCSNPRISTDDATVALVKELIANNVLVLQTGCAAIACAKEGLLTPEAAYEMAGSGLREVCETVGIPPVLHMGSCVDNSRLLMAATHVVQEGGLGECIADLPVAGAAPEWMSEKAVAIGSYFVASGVYTVLGHPLYTSGSERLTKLLCGELEGMVGGRFAYIEDPMEAAASIIDHLQSKREKLGIHRKQERKLFDMRDRRGFDRV